MKKFFILLLVSLLFFSAKAQKIKYKTKTNIAYYPDSISQTDKYIQQRCKLDIYTESVLCVLN